MRLTRWRMNERNKRRNEEKKNINKLVTTTPIKGYHKYQMQIKMQ